MNTKAGGLTESTTFCSLNSQFTKLLGLRNTYSRTHLHKKRRTRFNPSDRKLVRFFCKSHPLVAYSKLPHNDGPSNPLDRLKKNKPNFIQRRYARASRYYLQMGLKDTRQSLLHIGVTSFEFGDVILQVIDKVHQLTKG